MKKLPLLFSTILINVLITLALIYFFVWSKLIYIEAGAKVSQDLSLNQGSIILGENTTVTGKINLNQGKIVIGPKSKISGDIHLVSGDLKIDQDAQIFGNITIDQGNLNLQENVQITGDVQLNQGEMQKDSSAKITGKKPALFITTNWPSALAYFDSLPEKHKQAVGYIMLTKYDNTSIRAETVTKATDYFDGIYYYQDQKLQSINLNDTTQTTPFFDQAKKFFTSLPERRLGPFSVGATTKNFALNPAKADIYVPSIGSKYTFIHEMGHVLDYQQDFSDLHNPKYPFISKEAALNSYGATHPGEDFAEAYKYYVVNPQTFSDLIKDLPERQEKYDYLKNYVFNNQEYFS